MSTAAEVIQFPSQPQQLEAKQGMYSERFKQGYVMSSRLYREEVRPFLSDAARNVYAELEDRINGHQKDSDFVSWTQLQGQPIKGARKISPSTVKVGLAMLLANGVVSVIDSGKQGIKKYQINEVSLIGKKIIKPSEKEASNYFGNSSTTENEPLRKPKQTTTETVVNHYGNSSETTTEIVVTIDNKILLDSLREEEEESAQEKQNFKPQNRQLNFVEYHTADRTPISLRDLFKKYSGQVDFFDQAKASFPNHTDEQILTELRKMCQWSLTALNPNRSPQAWMTSWLSWMQKVPTATEQAAAAKRKTTAKSKPQAPKYHQYGQPQQTNSIRDVGGNHE